MQTSEAKKIAPEWYIYQKFLEHKLTKTTLIKMYGKILTPSSLAYTMSLAQGQTKIWLSFYFVGYVRLAWHYGKM